ncbi:MAG: ABC transporter permease [Deltaproteobacteria bacterium]|nr:ABC transporter permease [Deltaproteobacteria bacterium]
MARTEAPVIHKDRPPELMDVRVAEASRFYKWYLIHERAILGFSGVILFLLAWEYVGGYKELINPIFMSAPSRILKAGYGLFASGEIWNDLRVSGTEFIVGYVLAAVIGIPFGILAGWYKKFFYITDPFLSSLNATPRVALLPLIIIWVGIGIWSKIVIVFLGALFPILLNTLDGVKTTDERLLKAARSFGADDFQIFRTVVLPATVPFILSGGLRRGPHHRRCGCDLLRAAEPARAPVRQLAPEGGRRAVGDARRARPTRGERACHTSSCKPWTCGWSTTSRGPGAACWPWTASTSRSTTASS